MPRRPDLEAIPATGGRQRDGIDFFVGSLTRGKGYCHIHSTHTLSACGNAYTIGKVYIFWRNRYYVFVAPKRLPSLSTSSSTHEASSLFS